MKMTDPNPTADDQGQAKAPALRDEILELLTTVQGDYPLWADAIIHLLNERGHYLPGCPPAAQILKDAEQFAGQLMLSNLCVRLLRMLGTKIVTPETKPMERWLNDYIDGRNHGPLGKPMFWPQNLPGLCQQLRDWGFAPTATHPPFVSRARQMTLQ